MDGLGTDASKVRSLFIAVDPGQDTLQLLTSYLANFHSSFIGLTGTEAEVAQSARAFQTHYAKVQTGPNSYVMDHSGSIYLLSASGRLRGFLDTHEPIETGIAKARLALNRPDGSLSE